MHAEAYEWVSRYATDAPVTVLDIGGRYINGSVRDLFPNSDYLVLDVEDGSMVDIVADAATWDPYSWWDVVVCCEVCEHTAVWREILGTAFLACRPGGRMILTTAGPGRPEHSGYDGMHLRDGEYYANIEPAELLTVLDRVGFVEITVDVLGFDVRAAAIRPEE